MQVISKVVNRYKGRIEVVKTDITKDPSKLVEFGIMSTPAIILNGKLAFEGPPSAKELRKCIEAAL